MNPIVTGDQHKDSYTIMSEIIRILTICETLEKRLMPSEDAQLIRLIDELEKSAFDIKDCAISIFDQSGEHS